MSIHDTTEHTPEAIELAEKTAEMLMTIILDDHVSRPTVLHTSSHETFQPQLDIALRAHAGDAIRGGHQVVIRPRMFVDENGIRSFHHGIPKKTPKNSIVDLVATIRIDGDLAPKSTSDERGLIDLAFSRIRDEEAVKSMWILSRTYIIDTTP